MEEAEASNTGSSSANSADSAKPGVADGRTPNLRNAAKIRDVYERAVSNIPPIPDKRYWRRYLYLWLNYTCYEELTACDVNRLVTSAALGHLCCHLGPSACGL